MPECGQCATAIAASRAMPTAITAFGFDYGARRIGVAVGQSVTRTAEPLATIEVRNGRPDWDAIARLIAAWRPQQLVLGLPSHADGKGVHSLKATIERFGRRLHGRFHLPVAFVDERLSSYAAEGCPAVPQAGLDAVAARLILETWLAGQPATLSSPALPPAPRI